MLKIKRVILIFFAVFLLSASSSQGLEIITKINSIPQAQ